MVMICFFGPDGSGKTTLARALARYLFVNNFVVRLVWMRGTHTFASIIARFLNKFDIFHGFDNPYYKIKIPRKMHHLWYFLEFVSIIPVFFQRLVIPSLMGLVVVAERSPVDFIIWNVITSKDISFLRSIYTRFFISYLARGDKTCIYITANPRILVKRKPGEMYDKLLLEVALYNLLAKYLNAYKIDTTDKKISESLKEILKVIRCV